MEESALDVAWNKFIEDEGRAIEKEIYEELQELSLIHISEPTRPY